MPLMIKKKNIVFIFAHARSKDIKDKKFYLLNNELLKILMIDSGSIDKFSGLC